MTQWLAGMRMTSGRMNDNTLEESVSSGLTPATNFTVSGFSGRKVNGITTISINCARNATALTANAAGNITDTLMCTLPVGWRPVESIPFIFNAGSVADGAGTILTSGTCTLTSLSPNAVGASLSYVFTASWISENG